MSSIAANCAGRLLALLLTLGYVDSAYAATPANEARVVARLYKDFAWQAMTGQPELFGANLTHQGKSTLGRYFAPVLVDLLVKDAACQVKYQGICNLDFDLLFDAQDPRVTDLDVDTVGAGMVSVVFKDPVDGKKTRIDFKMALIAGAWKIVDVVYANGGLSLTTILSRRLSED